GTVAGARPPVPEEERRGHGGAARREVDDLARAGEAGVPGDGVGMRPEAGDDGALDDLRAGREEVGGAVVVARVERLAPGADDARGRGLAAAATRQQSQDAGCGEPGTHDLPDYTRGADGLRALRGSARDPGPRPGGREGEDRAARGRVGPRAPLPARALHGARPARP